MSDDLRNRVARAIANVREGGWPADTYAMLQQHYLTMADAALAEIGGVRVKSLEWEEYPVRDAPILTRAVTPNGTYFICDDTDDFTGLYCEFVSYKDATWYGTVKPSTAVVCDHQHVDDPATLKAAAQADYEARILAAIEPAPASVREAARVLLDASKDGEVWLMYVNAMMPVLKADMSADSWNTVDEIRAAFAAGLRAIAEGKDDD